jgi:hypothetical protein
LKLCCATSEVISQLKASKANYKINVDPEECWKELSQKSGDPVNSCVTR